MPLTRYTATPQTLLFTSLEILTALAWLAAYGTLLSSSVTAPLLWAVALLIPVSRLFLLVKQQEANWIPVSYVASALAMSALAWYSLLTPGLSPPLMALPIYALWGLGFIAAFMGLKPTTLRWLYTLLTTGSAYALLWKTPPFPTAQGLLFLMPAITVALLFVRQQQDVIRSLKYKENNHRRRLTRLSTEALSYSKTARHLRASQKQLERAVQARTSSLEQLNQELTRSTERLSLALKANELILWDWNIQDNRTTYVKESHEAQHSLDGSFIEHLAKRISEEDYLAFSQQLQAHMSGETTQFKVVYAITSTPENEPQWFRDEGQVVERHPNTGKPLRMLGLRKNITAEMREQERQRFAAAVFNAASEGVVVFNADFYILTVNERFTTMTGYDYEELLNQPLRTFSPQQFSGEPYQSIKETLNKHGHWEGELIEQRKDGETYPMWVQISTLYDDMLKRTYYVALCSDRTEEKRVEERVRFLSHFDRLTGLANRSLFLERLNRAITLARLTREQVALIAIDLDRFKPINDTMGPQVGDALLQQVTQRLLENGIHRHHLARVGGDEFTVLIENSCSRSEVQGVCTTILQALRAPFFIENHELLIGASIGVASFPTMANDAHSLIYKANLAMEQAKHLGGNNAFFYHEGLRHRTKDQLSLEAQLHKAIKNNELMLYFQPQWSLKENRIVGVESLVRWHHPELGLQSPAQFISIAEEAGLIEAIGEWVLNAACKELKVWESQGLDNLCIAVNLSAYQLRRGDLPRLVRNTLKKHEVPAHKLDLELTESLIMENLDDNIAQLQQLRELGVNLSLDDFGTGYSSLSYLKRFPINNLKIDRSFITDITQSAQDCAITQAIIHMAHNLDLTVVAEGVESQRQLEVLADMGCDTIQGYYISRPLPEAEIKALLLQQKNAVAPIQAQRLPH